MTRLITVTFTSTSGDESTGTATLLADDTTVEMPSRMMLRVTSAIDAGEGYAIVAHRNGYRYPLQRIEGNAYKLDPRHATTDRWLQRLADAFLEPSKDQKQLYGRYCHTLSAASIVSSVGYGAGSGQWTAITWINIACLVGLAAVLFVIGAVFSKGDK